MNSSLHPGVHSVDSIKVAHDSQNMGYPNRGIPYFTAVGLEPIEMQVSRE